MTEMMQALAAPFPPTAIHWRQQGKPSAKGWVVIVPYLDARAVMSRLDAVVGPFGWRDSYRAAPEGGIQCRLELRDPDGEWVAKEDAADRTDIEGTKGGNSDAFKRAAVKWGIGRYLYQLDVIRLQAKDGYGPKGAIYIKGADRKPYHVVPPQLPSWAMPAAAPRKETPQAKQARQAQHHPSFAAARAGFNAHLGKLGFAYDGVAAWLVANGRPRPSSMTPEQRAKLLQYLEDNAPKIGAAIDQLQQEAT